MNECGQGIKNTRQECQTFHGLLISPMSKKREIYSILVKWQLLIHIHYK